MNRFTVSIFCMISVAMVTINSSALATNVEAKKVVLDLSDKNISYVDGRNLVEKMHQQATNLKAYSFKYKMNVYDGKKVVTERGDFYYKNPNLIRLEEKGPYKKGAVAVLGPSGKVKAHLGGSLKLFVVELSADSGLLKSANGHPMIESDFKSLSKYLKSYVAKGMSVKASSKPLNVSGIKEKVFILDIKKKEDKDKLWKRVAVHPSTYLPIQWWDYNDSGYLHSHAQWGEIIKNRFLPDGLFTIKGAKSAKKQIEDRVSESKKKSNPASG